MMAWDIEAVEQGVPFGFLYDGVPSAVCLREWTLTQEGEVREADRLLKRRTWTDPRTGLSVGCDTIRFEEFSAIEWLVRFRNDGAATTPIISDVRDLDGTLSRPLPDGSFVLHKLKGAPSNPTDNEPSTVALRPGDTQTLRGGGGRSSNRDFPFFRVDTAEGCLIVAVGWSGQWQAVLFNDPQEPALRLRIGLEYTHFRLHPGESVRGCRMLVLDHRGDPERAHARFRRLLWKHYASRAHGPGSIGHQPIIAGPHQGKVEPQPILFCNTCFTRGGHWLNECNEPNQISLIHALAPLGVQAVITDAGWFKGGWPAGAGNWDPDPEKYPRGMAPVAAAAQNHGMIYGLWFEPERVAPNTAIEREHAAWILRSPRVEWCSLLDFGRPEVQSYFLGIVEQYLSLPGLRVYRQDFNTDPLPFWRDNDAPDRQGIHEMKYIEGLYAYWDRIRAAHPDLFMEECASGGRRTDLETLMRFQVHQKSDYWFDNLVDQASLFALSAYLPNAVISVPLNRLDEDSFHSAMASSLIVGWIADDPGFDTAAAKRILDVYRSVRHLLTGDWYGLTPWSRDLDHWLVSQYHRDDLGEGMILAFRRDHCASEMSVQLRSLRPEKRYELRSMSTGQVREAAGADLMRGLKLTISRAPGSDLLVYHER